MTKLVMAVEYWLAVLVEAASTRLVWAVVVEMVESRHCVFAAAEFGDR